MFLRKTMPQRTCNDKAPPSRAAHAAGRAGLGSTLERKFSSNRYISFDKYCIIEYTVYTGDNMELVNTLKLAYGENAPILISEIKEVMAGFTAAYVFRLIKKAIESGELSKYREGVYYIPTPSKIFGKSALNPYKVIEKMYLTNKGDVIGYLSGWHLLRSIGGTTQYAPFLEVVTNKEATRKREIDLGGRLVLRKPRCKVTSENAKILQVLDLCNGFTIYPDAPLAILEYARTNNVTERDILRFAKFYPAKAVKNALEVLYEAA